MKYKIKDEDNNIYEFENSHELLVALQKALGSEHYYYENGEWFQE